MKLMMTPDPLKMAPIVADMLFTQDWLREMSIDEPNKTNRQVQQEVGLRFLMGTKSLWWMPGVFTSRGDNEEAALGGACVADGSRADAPCVGGATGADRGEGAAGGDCGWGRGQPGVADGVRAAEGGDAGCVAGGVEGDGAWDPVAAGSGVQPAGREDGEG